MVKETPYPTVVTIHPADGSAAISVTTPITVRFSKQMAKASVEQGFSLYDKYGNVVPGQFTWSGTIYPYDTVTFSPAKPLKYGRAYEITISGECKDAIEQYPLGGYWTNVESHFWTELRPEDHTNPEIVSVYPPEGQAKKLLLPLIGAVLSKPIDPITVTTSNVILSGPGVIGYRVKLLPGPTRIQVLPYRPLEPQATYTVVLTTGVRDTNGNPLPEQYQWSFNSGQGDTTPPHVTQTIPEDGASYVSPESSQTIYFSESIDPVTVNYRTVKVYDDTTGTEQAFRLNKQELNDENGDRTYLQIRPLFGSRWNESHTYRVTLSSNITDISGNFLENQYTYTFNVVSHVSSAPQIDLDSCHGYLNPDGTTAIELRINAWGPHNDNITVQATDLAESGKNWTLWKSGSSTYEYRSSADEGLSPGTHTIRFTATDTVNNRSSSFQFPLAIPSSVPILTAPSDTSSNVSCTPTFSWTDSSSTSGEIYSIAVWTYPHPNSAQVVWQGTIVSNGNGTYRLDIPSSFFLSPGKVYYWNVVKFYPPSWNAFSQSQTWSFTTFVEDGDNDGLHDFVEAMICTRANDADTDDDGIIDGIEDANHNGIVDPGETDPCNVDTDGDGIQDGTELGLTEADIGPDTDTGMFVPDSNPGINTDPLNPDTDGDGMDDGWEEYYGLNPTVDDAFLDSDGDGFSNIREYLSQTNPDNNDEIPPVEADFDQDEDSDGLDLGAFVVEWDRHDCSEENPCTCDLDGDGDVDIVDLLFVIEDFGRMEES